MIRVPLYAYGQRAGAPVAHALIDDADAHLLAHRWRLHPNGYAARSSSGTVWMHRAVAGLERGDRREVDHRNHDALDNRRGNLRVVTRSQNLQNRAGAQSNSSSGVRGVWRRPNGRWRAAVRVDGREHTNGEHDTVEQATAAARDLRARLMTHAEAA